jgi:outer membrane protein assembly factor BamA
MRLGPLWIAGIALWLLAAAQPARADSYYEWDRTQKLLTKLGLTPEEAPDGKRIAYVQVVRDDVFVEDEIWPTWWNVFHGLTREHIVRRELLFDEGDAYTTARIEETMRNLRGMLIFALVRITAVKTKDPNAVGIIVHTRDLWSLRIEEDFTISTQIDSLLIRLTERNLAGRNHAVGADYTLLPNTYTLREFYSIRRVWGSTFKLGQTGALIFNRARGVPEGTDVWFTTGQPFYNLAQRFAWAGEAEYETRVARQVQTGKVLYYQPVEGGPYARRVWRSTYRTASLGGSYRRGQAFKQAFGLGWDYRQLTVKANHETALPDSLEDDFKRDVLPRARLENGPYASYDIVVPRWVTFVNLGTYGQSENVRVGPSTNLSVRAPLSQFGSTSNSWVLGGSAGFVLAPGGGLVEAKVSASTRYENEKLVDQVGSAYVRGATPVIHFFRFVARAAIESRRRDTSQSLVALGAANGLRGYTSQRFYGYGASRMLANFEIRTLPIEWQAVHIGGVIFYDVGAVYARLDEVQLHHAVGVGVRVLFPQFNRYPFSFDGGMPAGDPDFRIVPTFTSGQVVPLTALEDG